MRRRLARFEAALVFRTNQPVSEISLGRTAAQEMTAPMFELWAFQDEDPLNAGKAFRNARKRRSRQRLRSVAPGLSAPSLARPLGQRPG